MIIEEVKVMLELFVQLGMGGGALFILYKLGDRAVSQNAKLMADANEAREKDIAASRGERVSQAEAFSQALAEQQDRFIVALKTRDDNMAKVAHEGHTAAHEVTGAVKDLKHATTLLTNGVGSLREQSKEQLRLLQQLATQGGNGS